MLQGQVVRLVVPYGHGDYALPHRAGHTVLGIRPGHTAFASNLAYQSFGLLCVLQTLLQYRTILYLYPRVKGHLS